MKLVDLAGIPQSLLVNLLDCKQLLLLLPLRPLLL